MQGMNANAAALRALHMQAPLPKIDLRPAKTAANETKLKAKD
jgi:hypothetical protein